MALRNESISAMGASPEDFQFVVQDVLESTGKLSRNCATCRPHRQMGAEFFLNQNSREPVTEPR